MNIQADFYVDWIALLAGRLAAWGHDVPADPQDTSARYFKLRQRQVSAVPRRIEMSAELTCPPVYREGHRQLRNKIENGIDLTPHLSRKITKPDFDDDLLSDWGVQHLHLGTKTLSNGMIEGTADILFVWFTPTHAYEIQILSHNDWANKVILEIVRQNWPFLLAPFKLQGVTVPAVPSNLLDTTGQRQLHLTAPVILSDGAVYGPPGGGISTDGTANAVVEQMDRCARTLHEWQEAVIGNPERLKESLLKAGWAEGQDVALHLEFHSTGAMAVTRQFDKSCGWRLGDVARVDPPPGRP